MSSASIKLIYWYPSEFGSVNGLSFIKISYTRQMADNPVVKVDSYKFFNTDEAVEITLSYRLSERELWENDFMNVINTFSFKTKK